MTSSSELLHSLDSLSNDVNIIRDQFGGDETALVAHDKQWPNRLVELLFRPGSLVDCEAEQTVAPPFPICLIIYIN
jgi:hypothetical protein